MAAEQNDEELLLRVSAQDAFALEVLYERYSRLFMGIGLRILGDRGEAEEIVQDIFVYLYQSRAL
jgi:RNA polymerase sigma-70 factor (ECF subfamily)